MNDPIDGRLRQLVQEIHDASPDAHPWDQIGLTPSIGGAPRSRWLLATIAAAAVGLAAVGAVTLSRDHRQRPNIQGSKPQPIAATSISPVPSTTAIPVATSASPTTQGAPSATSPSVTTSTVSTPLAGQLPSISVSYRTPPAELNLQPFASIELPAGSGGPDSLPPIAALDGGRAAVVDSDRHQIIVVEPNGYRTVVPLTIDPGPFLVSGGHDMVYGIVQRPTGQNQAGAVSVAIPLTGPHAGDPLETAPIDINPYTEVAATILGHGKDAIINRHTGETVIPYKDTTGGPRGFDVAPPNYRLDNDGTIRASDNTAKWSLSIERAPDYSGPYVDDPAPAQIGDGRTVYWTSIGSPVDASKDFPVATLPVIAVLEADGTGTWYRVPVGWQVVASDEEGVVFARRVGSTVEIASLSPRPPAAETTFETVPLGVSTTTVSVP